MHGLDQRVLERLLVIEGASSVDQSLLASASIAAAGSARQFIPVPPGLQPGECLTPEEAHELSDPDDRLEINEAEDHHNVPSAHEH